MIASTPSSIRTLLLILVFSAISSRVASFSTIQRYAYVLLQPRHIRPRYQRSDEIPKCLGPTILLQVFFLLQHGNHSLFSGLARLLFFGPGDPLHKFFFVRVGARVKEFPDFVLLEKFFQVCGHFRTVLGLKIKNSKSMPLVAEVYQMPAACL